MSWNVRLILTNASDGSPVSGLPLVDATAQGAQLAVTDENGAATVTLDVDTSLPNTLCIAGTRFSIEPGGIRILDKELYTRLASGLPGLGGETAEWNVTYWITDSETGA